MDERLGGKGAQKKWLTQIKRTFPSPTGRGRPGGRVIYVSSSNVLGTDGGLQLGG